MQHQAPSRSGLSAASWRKSSYSQGEGADCVELARVAITVCVRDSKDRSGPGLVLSPAEARTLAVRIKDGELDL
ncbi:DUF397 domain-containing protein [Spirillospora sp. NPDC052269]